MGRKIAPGMRRSFAAESISTLSPASEWAQAREEAKGKEVEEKVARKQLRLFGSDIDQRAVQLTHSHLRAADVQQHVQLSVADVARVAPPPGEFGCIVTNPPYGMRLGESQRANEELASLWRKLDTWSLFALSGDVHFEEDIGRKATKRRKLYNGKLPCQLYQYFGPLPPRPPRNSPPADAVNVLFIFVAHRKFARSACSLSACAASGWNEDQEMVNVRIDRWVCIKNCGACCYLAPDFGPEPPEDPEDAQKFKEMIGEDGWCVNLDKETKRCRIYQDRPSFCRTSAENFERLYNVPKRDFQEVAIGACKQTIIDVFGDESLEYDRYLRAVGEDSDEDY
mmetsp:Transcript_26884/g.87957  ORF Transcript_26884/g.87957 Transcript_26884/m.87957 type:complete len:339 (-) Transcript_26884:108-1124(-)